MDTYLFSIHPKWCEKIFNGEKTIEVRKTAPKPPFKVVVYCTKSNNALAYLMPDKSVRISDKREYGIKYSNKNIVGSTSCGVAKNINGKVIGEFVCDKVDTISVHNDMVYSVNNLFADKLKNMCLTVAELKEYLGAKNNGYAIGITALKVYDKPKELGEFRKPCGDCIGKCTGEHYERCPWQTVTRPPQSYMRIQDTKEV